METVMKKAINRDTGQHYLIEMPGPEPVRQAILALDFPDDGIRVVVATEALAEKFQLSDEQKRAKNRSGLNVFRYDVVAPQFKWLLRENELEQPGGPKTPYFLAGSGSDSPDSELRETSHELEWTSSVELVKRTAVNPDTVELPATHVVKQALLDFDYPASGIEIKDVAENLADQFVLADEEKNARGNYGLVWRRHVTIAAGTLVNSGKLLRLRRGWITNPEQPDGETVDPPDNTSPFSDGDTPSPEVFIEQNYQHHRDRLKEDLLEKIMDNPPDFFEELVLDLLVEMGYGGSRADAEAVGRSGDGGIDGIINQDKLGLDSIYVQAKRWAEGSVGSPEIDKFSGALARKGASKGVFITTSSFTKKAKAAANESAGPKIILIDGKQLVQLMIDHELGVSSGNSYHLKEVDLDYFAIDNAVDDN